MYALCFSRGFSWDPRGAFFEVLGPQVLDRNTHAEHGSSHLFSIRFGTRYLWAQPSS